MTSTASAAAVASSAVFPGKVFVSAADAAARLREFHLLDARYYLAPATRGVEEFLASHVDGSTFVDVNGEMCGSLEGTTARHPLPRPEDFIVWASAVGLNDHHPALCYDSTGGGLGACRLWWMLTALGVEAYVVCGGYQALAAVEGVPLAECSKECLAGERQQREQMIADSAFRTASLAGWPYSQGAQNGSASGCTFPGNVTVRELKPNDLLTDARAANRFSGTVRALAVDVLPGHVPGAVNVPWDQFVVDHNGAKMLKPEDEVRATMSTILNNAGGPQLADGSGVADASACVFSCGSGLSACFNIAAAVHLGMGRPRLYCGSWSEYVGLFGIDIARSIVDTHGMLLQMVKDNNALPAVAVDPAAAKVTVDGVPFDQLDAATAETTRAALRHLAVGEEAVVLLRGGRRLRVAVESL